MHSRKWVLKEIRNKSLKILTSSNLLTVSLHCGICVTKFDVVGLLKSSLVSRRKSLTVITPGISVVYKIITLSNKLLKLHHYCYFKQSGRTFIENVQRDKKCYSEYFQSCHSCYFATIASLTVN